MSTEIGLPDDELQFATAEPAVVESPSAAVTGGQTIVAEPATVAPLPRCVVCKQAIRDTYFAIRDKILCPACCERIKAPPTEHVASRWIKAGVSGLVIGLAGALVWFIIRRAAHTEIGLVAVAIGILIGKAVRKGSGGRGGPVYQVMAVLLTYFCITANYIPDVVEAHMQYRPGVPITPEIAGRIVWVAIQVPFLEGASNVLGLLIIGIGLWQAWKITRRIDLPITGPYQVGAGVGVAPPAFPAVRA
jgi:hypothetical protein